MDWVTEYLDRIGADRPAARDDRSVAGDEALRELHRRHLYTVPFENLSIHLGEDIVLDDAALVAKVARRRRGGFCYELNGAFAALLRALGYDVEYLAARVYGEHGLGVPYDHMVLRVGPWLADVGFGDHSHHPLRWDHTDDQSDPAGTFRMVPAPDGDLDLLRDGEPQYRLWTRPQRLLDFRAGCWWHRTSPESHFTRSTVCSLTTVDGRISLSGRRLIRTVGGTRHEHELTTDAEVLDAYRVHFGVTLDRVPVVKAPAG